MRERDVERHLVQRVKALGGEVRKVKWIGRNGAPDRVVMLPAREIMAACECCVEGYKPRPLVWVELKAPAEKAKPHQLREHERMRKMGQNVVVLDSIEAVDNWLGDRGC